MKWLHSVPLTNVLCVLMQLCGESLESSNGNFVSLDEVACSVWLSLGTVRISAISILFYTNK